MNKLIQGNIMIKHALIVAAITTTTLLIGGCATHNHEQSTVGQMVDDAKITTQIKARYAESPVVRALAIRVNTDGGHVTLSGYAKSSEEKNTAESIARNVPHVRSVKNNIVIQP